LPSVLEEKLNSNCFHALKLNSHKSLSSLPRGFLSDIFIFLYERLKMVLTFELSQRGAKSRTTIRPILKRVQDEAEIIPKEPGQVMLPREAIIVIR